MKTIRELAAESGKSKTAIMKKIENLGLRNSLRKNANQFVVDEEQEILIMQSFAEKKTQTENRKPVGEKPESLQLVGDVISTLKEQLTVKDNLIAEQQRTIRELTTALENTTASLQAAQALHAGTIRNQLTENNSEGIPEEPEPVIRNRFFNIFKRQKKETQK